MSNMAKERTSRQRPISVRAYSSHLNDSKMLPFHRQIQEEASTSDSLHILARGLGMHQALCQLILSAVSKDSLILALNVSRPLATSLIYPALTTQTTTSTTVLLPRILSADYSVRDRVAVYSTSGLIIVTAAVLVHDLLHNTLPANRVNGIVIFAADTIKERSNHHFALNLFRHRNKSAFIKAFSESPVPLSAGFHTVEKLMRILYVSRLCLWPRFHTAVRDSLKNHVPDLIDLSVPTTARMASLLSAFHNIVEAVLLDIRNATHAVDYSEIYSETSDTDPSSRKHLVPNFDDVVRRQLRGGVIRNARVRGLLSDLTTLKRLLKDLFELNPVAFYQGIVTVRATVTHGANWLVRKDAQRAVLLARSRVWLNRKDGNGVRVVPNLEVPPKWEALRDVLREIEEDVKTAGPSADVGRVLVLVRDQRTVDELRQVLQIGGEAMLKNQFEEIFPTIAARIKEDEGMKQVTMTQIVLPENERRPLGKIIGEEGQGQDMRQWRKRKRPRAERNLDIAREELMECFGEVKSEKSAKIEILLWCVEWVDLQGRGHRVLDEYRPAFVVMYNADLALVRQVEVYKASQPGRPVRLYILAYDDAVDEDRFRYASEREKTAFKSLIRERATMTIYVNQEGREPEEEFTQSLIDTVDATYALGRRGLGADRDSRLAKRQPVANAGDGGRVLVDTRELRSSLPMLLYQSRLAIVPLTLEVGDFILSKNIGIERKSVSDLYSSFASGRLFNQAEALCRHYSYPCLLIELDSDRPLSLTATAGGVPSELVATSITSKMVLLLQQFPKLRLLWAKGAHDASELFAALKVNEEEPDMEIAASLGVDTEEKKDEDYNAGPRALLRSLPGVDSQNIANVMRNVRNVADLVALSKEEMAKLLGNAGKAKALYDFVNEQPGEALAAL